MAFMDDWGRNPEVLRMRRVFQAMESAQKRLLDGTGISPFDDRLRGWREKARVLFDRLWSEAGCFGNANETRFGLLYAHCLGRTISDGGIPIPENLLPKDREIEALLKGGRS